jgi:hypothetical protein
MWYPEEPVTYCRQCEIEVPIDCFWRGLGTIISGSGHDLRTTVLYSQCPECGYKQSVGLDGPLWFRIFYGWLWRLRYPRTRPPILDLPAAEEPRRRGAER